MEMDRVLDMYKMIMQSPEGKTCYSYFINLKTSSHCGYLQVQQINEIRYYTEERKFYDLPQSL